MPTTTDFEKRIELVGKAWNDFGGDKGVGSPKLRFALIGPKGAITFTVFTHWHLPETYEAWKKAGLEPDLKTIGGGMGGAIVIHSPSKTRDYYGGPDKCDVLPGGECYGDAGFTAGSTLYDRMLREGDEAVWETLAEWYEDAFEKEDEA